MLRDRLELYRDRVRRNLTAAFEETHSPHHVGVSFAIGVFLTTLPTGGLGIGLFFVFAYLFSWVSKPAMFASVAVLNPFVKPFVYLASFQVGGLFLGDPVGLPDESTLSAMLAVGLKQALVGFLVLAVVFSVVGYAVVFHLTRAYRRRQTEDTVSVSSIAMGLFGKRRR